MPPKDIFINTNQAQPRQQSQPQSQPQTQPMTTPVAPTPVRKVSAKLFIIVGIAVVAIILVLFALKFFTKSTPGSSDIVWWGLWEDESTVAPLISAYQQSHSNVKITYKRQSQQDYRERLTSALAKKTGPDIFTFHNTWIPMFRNDLDSLPASVISPSDYAKIFYPIVSSDLISGSSIVGIPLGYDALTLYINENIFDKAGVTPPVTWDDLRKRALSLTTKDDQGAITQAGVSLGRTENIDHWPEILALLMIQNGVDLGNPTGRLAEDALNFFVQFSKVDGVWDATLPSSTQAFAAGKLAMYIGPSWRVFEIEQQNPNLKFKTVPVPQLPKDNPKQPDTTYATYWAQGVWSGSTKKAVVWDFLKFLSTQDSLQKLYTAEAQVRSFGEPYPRPDMANLLTNHPLVGSIVSQAPGAVTWYLASRTFDGPTGINTLLANYFADAVNSVADGKSTANKALPTVADGVAQVLKQYGLIAR